MTAELHLDPWSNEPTRNVLTPGREALAEAMRLEQARIYSQPQHEHRSERRQTITKQRGSRFPTRPLDSYYGPAPADWIDELIEAIAPPARGRRSA